MIKVQKSKKITWYIAQKYQMGRGNWKAFPKDDLSKLYKATKEWKEALAGVDKPWLCWCMDDEWCYVQQKLIEAIGWTPVIGTDGRVTKPTLLKNSILIDFNKYFNYPIVTMQFPLEFVFLFTNKLAFWHSDVLPPLRIMKKISSKFNNIKRGEYMGIRIRPPYSERWFEVLGCTTKAASQSQFDYGCGIWRYITHHPNFNKKVITNPFYDHGTGIFFWETKFKGKAKELGIDINPYHYSITSKEGYIRKWINSRYMAKSKYDELKINFKLSEIVKEIGLTKNVRENKE